MTETQSGKYIPFITFSLSDLFRKIKGICGKFIVMRHNGPCLGWRESYSKPYQWLTYNETLLRARNLGSGLVEIGLKPGPNTMIGIYAINCPEWILVEQAAYCYSMVIVPLYDTLGADACSFIIKHAEIQVILVEDDTKCNSILEKSPRCLKKLIVFKDVRPATKQRAKNMGIEILKLQDVELLGSKANNPEIPPKPADMCTICYTSGTTGQPKGVMLTHENVVASMSSVVLQFGDHRLKSDDVMLSFLPLAHMMERCCEGYFKDPEKTEEVVDDQGWHHTGDIGMWMPNGTLKIIDRRKHIFKLSQGEYIVPEKIENIYIRSQYVAQVFVHGESLKSCIIAVVVPDVDVIKCWAQENGISGTFSILCNHPEVKQLIIDDMVSWGKESGLKSFEQVKDIYLHPDPFSVQNGLLTPTLKSKRPQLKTYFKPQLDDMYSRLT
ncbi:hypothetical protein YQE_05543, partial [Dendroctonus ponderosae]